MAPSVGIPTAETVVSSGTQWTMAPDGGRITDLTKTSGLRQKLLQSGGSTPEPSLEESNAHFMKSLHSVYEAVKKLESEVAKATNTKREIKECTASLSTATSKLIHWGRLSCRVPRLTSVKGCQTPAEEEKVYKVKATQTSPELRPEEKKKEVLQMPAITHIRTRSESDAVKTTPTPNRFEVSGTIGYLMEEVKLQKSGIGELAEKIEKFMESQQIHQDEQSKRFEQLQQQMLQKSQQETPSEPPQQKTLVTPISQTNKGPQEKQIQKPQRKQKQQQPQQKQQKQLQQKQPQQQKQQQQPPKQQQQCKPTWSEVVKRKEKKRKTVQVETQPRSVVETKLDLLRKRVPKTAAVTIDRPPEGGSLSDVMKKISKTIDLKALGIIVKTTRTTRAGGVLLEVEGEDKAALLAERVRVLIGDGARVRQPETLTPVLLLDVPEWAAEEDVIEGLRQVGVEAGADRSPSVSVWKNSGGRKSFVARVNLPYREAIKLTEAKAVTVGWTRCRVKPIEKNLPTCFRCQERGHLAAECKNPAKPRRCHRCGGIDHLQRECRQPEKKEEAGREEERRQGGSGAKGTRPSSSTVPEVEELAGQTASTSRPDRAQ